MGRLSNPRDEPRTRPFLIKNLPPDAGFSHFSTKWTSITLTEQFAGILKESRALPVPPGSVRRALAGRVPDRTGRAPPATPEQAPRAVRSYPARRPSARSARMSSAKALIPVSRGAERTLCEFAGPQALPPARSAISDAPMTTRITIRKPDDWHLHVRDGDMLKAVLPHTARHFGRAILMPNLVPPIRTVQEGIAYRE